MTREALALPRFETRLFIGGELVAGNGPESVAHDPSRGSVLARVAAADAAQAAQAVETAHRAYLRWRRTTPKERSRLLWAVAERIEDHAARLARIESLNTGAPLRQVETGDLAAAADVFRYFATAVRNLPGAAQAGAPATVLRHEPLGVLSATLPATAPLLAAARRIAPAIAAGNTLVLHPSELTPLGLLSLAPILNEVLPEGVVNVIAGAPVAHPLLRRALPPQRYAAKSPVIVLADADLDRLAGMLQQAAFAHAGQQASAPGRILVDCSVTGALADRLTALMGALIMGPPEREETALGPLISEARRAQVAEAVAEARAGGAELLCGGTIPSGPGWFYPPTLLLDVPTEVFGPVLSLIPVEDPESAVEEANALDAPAASVWSRDTAAALRIAEELRHETVSVNGSCGSGKGYSPDLSMPALLAHTRARHLLLG